MNDKGAYQVYGVAHICCCPKCRGKIYTHSQSDWDGHLRFVEPMYITNIRPNTISTDPIKRLRQVKMLASRHMKGQAK